MKPSKTSPTPISESQQFAPTPLRGSRRAMYNMLRYGLAVVSITIGLLLRFALELPVGTGLPTYVTFYPFVMLTALVGGFGPGLASTILTLMAVDIWIFPPVGQFTYHIWSSVELMGFALFGFMGLFISLVAELYRRSRTKAAAYDREQALRETRKEREFLAYLLQNAEQPFAMGFLDGSLTLFNRALETLTGYTGQELHTIDWSSNLTPPEWREPERRKLDELKATGKPVRYEKECIRKDGSRVPIEILAHIGREVVEGGRTYYYSFITDLTERKKVEAKVREANVRLQQHASEVQAANSALRESRLAALNLAEDADTARRHAEKISRELIKEITERKQIEAALRESEERFRTMFESHGAVMLLIEPTSGTIVNANRAAESFYGYSGDELRSMTIQQINLLPPEQVESERHKAMEKERNVFEFKHRLSGGQVRTVEVYSSPIQVADTLLLFSIIQDISERKTAEEALRESEQKYRTLFENMAEEVHYWQLVRDEAGNITTWRLVDVNPPALTTWGRASVDEIRGKAIDEIFGPGAMEHNMPVILKIIKENVPHSYEDYFPNLDKYYRFTSVPLGDYFITTGADITQIKKAEIALRGERELLNTIFNSIPVMLTIYDPQDLTFNTSKYLQTVTGWTDEDMQQPNALEKVCPDPNYRAMVAEYVRSLQPGFKDLLMTAKNGEIIETSWANTRLADGRQIGIGLDIRERKRMEVQIERRAEELAAANRDLESFSYSVSHDLRNPLNAIGGFAGFLIEDYAERLDEEGRDYLRRIDEGVKKMKTLINDMLNLSRIGRQEMRREDVNLSAIMREYLQELKATEPERRAEFVIQGDVHASADPQLIHLALENLLRNAWKFTNKKEIARIEFGTMIEENQTVYFIRDNGVGFNMKFSKKIFEPFTRVHADREFGGTGVGLSIVQRVIGRHGGKVRAEGEVGKGAVFYFTLS